MSIPIKVVDDNSLFLKKLKKIFFVFICSFILWMTLISKETTEIYLHLSEEKILLKDKIENQFFEIEKTIRSLAKTIELFCDKDNKKIEKLLKVFSTNDFPSWLGSYISWADASGNIIISGKKGVLEKSDIKSIKDRGCYINSIKTPNELRVSEVSQNKFSSRSVLPTCMMVTDENHKALGFLVFSLNIDTFVNYVRRFISNGEIVNISFNKDGFSLIISMSDYNIIELKRKTSDQKISVEVRQSIFSTVKTSIVNYGLYFSLLISFLLFVYLNNKIIKKMVIEPIFLITGKEREFANTYPVLELFQKVKKAHDILKTYSQTIKSYEEARFSYRSLIRFTERSYSNLYKKFNTMKRSTYINLLKSKYRDDFEIQEILKIIENFEKDLFLHSKKEFYLFDLVSEGIGIVSEKASENNIEIGVFHDKSTEGKIFHGNDLKYAYIFRSLMQLSINMIIADGKINVNIVSCGESKAIIKINVTGKLISDDFYVKQDDLMEDRALCRYRCVDDVINMADDFSVRVEYDERNRNEKMFMLVVENEVVKEEKENNIIKMF